MSLTFLTNFGPAEAMNYINAMRVYEGPLEFRISSAAVDNYGNPIKDHFSFLYNHYDLTPESISYELNKFWCIYDLIRPRASFEKLGYFIHFKYSLHQELMNQPYGVEVLEKIKKLNILF